MVRPMSRDRSPKALFGAIALYLLDISAKHPNPLPRLTKGPSRPRRLRSKSLFQFQRQRSVVIVLGIDDP